MPVGEPPEGALVTEGIRTSPVGFVGASAGRVAPLVGRFPRPKRSRRTAHELA